MWRWTVLVLVVLLAGACFVWARRAPGASPTAERLPALDPGTVFVPEDIAGVRASVFDQPVADHLMVWYRMDAGSRFARADLSTDPASGARTVRASTLGLDESDRATLEDALRRAVTGPAGAGLRAVGSLPRRSPDADPSKGQRFATGVAGLSITSRVAGGEPLMCVGPDSGNEICTSLLRSRERLAMYAMTGNSQGFLVITAPEVARVRFDGDDTDFARLGVDSFGPQPGGVAWVTPKRALPDGARLRMAIAGQPDQLVDTKQGPVK